MTPALHCLDNLNPEQLRAVQHGIAARGANVAGPLLIVAGAGSGKTNTLAHRVAHLIGHGADPGRVFLLTFSRRAAPEMERRVERMEWLTAHDAIRAAELHHRDRALPTRFLLVTMVLPPAENASSTSLRRLRLPHTASCGH